MEDRQTQIREGAGLEESKLNVEFIDWLRRWSTPIMGLIALVALGFVVNAKLEKRHNETIDKAFADLADATEQAAINPETLKTLAEENSGVKGVSIMARMKAADTYLQSARKGIKIGAKLGNDGSAPAEESLTEEQRTSYLSEAEKLYQLVLDETAADNKKAIHAIGAAYGLAAVAESRGNLEAAKAAYERVVKLAEYAGFDPQAAIAKKRIEGLPKLAEAPKLLSNSDLPKPPEPPKPAAPEAPAGTYNPGATGSTAPTGEPAPTGTPAATGATGSPASTGTPAPTGATGSPAATGGTPASPK